MVKSPIPAIQVGQIPSNHCLNPYLLFSNVILPSEILHVFPVPPVLLQQIRATFYSYSCWLRPQPRWFNLFKPSHLCGKTTHPIPSISSGGFNLPLWKNDGVKVSWDDEIPNIWKNKTSSKPPTSHPSCQWIAADSSPAIIIEHDFSVQIDMDLTWLTCQHIAKLTTHPIKTPTKKIRPTYHPVRIFHVHMEVS